MEYFQNSLKHRHQIKITFFTVTQQPINLKEPVQGFYSNAVNMEKLINFYTNVVNGETICYCFDDVVNYVNSTFKRHLNGTFNFV